MHIRYASHIDAPYAICNVMTELEESRYSLVDTAEVAGDVVAAKACAAFSELHPDAGLALFEPNMILAMADMKPLTYFPLYDASQRDIADVKEQFKQLVPSLGLHVFDVEPIDLKRCKVDFIHVVNFPALEGVTHQTTIANILPFTVGERSDGDALSVQFDEWYEEMDKRFSQPLSENSVFSKKHLLNGVLYGYPDRAILDYVHALIHGAKNLVLTVIPLTEDYYHPFSVNFQIYPNHIRETSIFTYIITAGSILRGFYKNPVCEDMLEHRDFQEALNRRTLITDTP